MIIQEPVQAAIWHCLNHYDYKDSIFLAERLCAEVESDETIFVLATSYYRANLLHQAYWLLHEKSPRHAPCRFLLAKCAFQLKKFSEAECVLTYSGFGDLDAFEDMSREFGETACFAFHLMAQICLKTERNKIAAEALRRALKLNPFMWQAYVDLCNMGEYPDPAAIFQIDSTDVFNTCQGNSNHNSMVLFGGGNAAGFADPTAAAPTQAATTTSSAGGGGGGGSESFIGNANGNVNSYILNTPVDQQLAPAPQNNNLNTPCGQYNLNSSITMLRGGAGHANNNTSTITTTTTSVGSNGNNNSNNNNNNNTSSSMQLFEDTPSGAGGNGGGIGIGLSGPAVYAAFAEANGAGTPFRKNNFKYLSHLSPPTPSFGVLPLNSPIVGSGGGGGSDSFINYSHTYANSSPSPQTLAENQDLKVIHKKTKSTAAGNGGGLITRKEPSAAANTIAMANKPAVFTQTGNITPRTPNIGSAAGQPGQGNPNAAVRRSSRLFGGSGYSVKENNKSPNITSSKFAQPRSPPRKAKTGRMPKISLNNEIIEEKSAKEPKEKVETITTSQLIGGGGGQTGTTPASLDDSSKVLLNNSLNSAQTMAHQLLQLKKQSADGLMALLRDLGECYKLLAHYQCKDAIAQFEATIPKHHLCSSWTQSLIGIAHYELREYEKAVSIFKLVHHEDPYRLDCMEIYSSSLWHLQQEIELSALAHDVLAQDKMSPVTWCIAGNCFSLHKEHETAIKFFKRAVQVNPDFVYSYTLLGHELVLTEELEKALDFFRAALMRDPRHYNAWFGIGTIYSKQEKYALAELHYIKALKINPHNSVIMVHIGAMQYFMQKKVQALDTLNAAAVLEPKNPLARFHRGSIYFSMGKHQEALDELEQLKEIVPKESVVFYLIGKIHKTLGNVDLALMHFSWATDLDPKGANNQIKDAFDSMSQPSFCPSMNDVSIEADLEQGSDRSEDSTQAQHDLLNYDSDIY